MGSFNDEVELVQKVEALEAKLREARGLVADLRTNDGQGFDGTQYEQGLQDGIHRACEQLAAILGANDA